MTKVQIQQEINKTKQQIDNYKSKKNKILREQQEIYEIIDRLNNSIRKTENGLNETLNAVKMKSSKLSQYSKFRITYNEEANRILKGNKAQNSLGKLRFALRKAQNKIMNTEDDIKYVNHQINTLTHKLERLKQQLNEAIE